MRRSYGRLRLSDTGNVPGECYNVDWEDKHGKSLPHRYKKEKAEAEEAPVTGQTAPPETAAAEDT